MKVLQLIFSIEKGGAESYLFNLIDSSIDKKIDIEYHLITNHIGYNHDKLAKQVEKTTLIKMQSIFDIKAGYRIAQYCRKHKIDIIQAHFLRESYIAVLTKIFYPKVKVLWTMHFSHEKKSFVKVLNKALSYFTDKIICVSKAVKDTLINEGINSKKLNVIYNGVDTETFKPLNQQSIRKELNIRDEELLLITVARFHKEKGHEFLIDALSEFKKFDIPFKALLVGDGDELENIKSRVEDVNLKNQVIFMGFSEEIPKLLSTSDIYLSPSVNEAISFSILESLSCEVPVIATEVGGIPEVLSGTDCGYMVTYGDKIEFANKIKTLYTEKELYNLMKKNGRKLVLEKFSKEQMLVATYEQYKSLLKK